MFSAIILGAGLGTRLRPLTDIVPKPLVPVGDRAAIFHVLSHVRGSGASHVVVNAHHRSEDLRTALGGEPDVAISDEAELLGTAGGVAYAEKLLGEGDVLVWNGDILVTLDAYAVAQNHFVSGAEATLVLQPREGSAGNVGVDARGDVVRLRGKALRAGEVRSGDFMGVHVIGAALRGCLPKTGCLVGDVYMPAVVRGARLATVDCDAPYFDIGTMANYRAANAHWLRERGLDSWVHPSARVGGGVSLVGSIVGAGASVDGEGLLERCVVWPGARAAAPALDEVIAY